MPGAHWTWTTLSKNKNDDNQNYTDEEAVDLSEDADLHGEDESNSKLSDQMDNLPQVTHTSQHQQSTNNG